MLDKNTGITNKPLIERLSFNDGAFQNYTPPIMDNILIYSLNK